VVSHNDAEDKFVETECAETLESPPTEEASLREERRRFRWLSRITLLLALSPWLLPFFILCFRSVKHRTAVRMSLQTIYPYCAAACLACGLVGILLLFRVLMKNRGGETLEQRRRRRLAVVAIVLSLLPCALFAGEPAYFFLISLQSDARHITVEERLLRHIFHDVDLTVQANARKLFPKLSCTPGRLMYDAGEVYESGHEMLYSPYIALRDPNYDKLRGKRNPDKTVDDSSFFYLGYRITNDQEMAAFASAYRNIVASGGNFEEDIVVPGGNGANGDLVIPRLNTRPPTLPENATRPPLPQNTARRIPIMIERIRNNRGKGAHVLYMDGHVEYLEYPGRWPMTRTTVELLDELDRLGNQGSQAR
jgi:prepilin-type processing-associated H-X9-DG protein